MTRSKTNTEQKQALLQVCDAESYVAILKSSLTEEQLKNHRPIHLANILALTAELYLTYYDAIGEAFETGQELAITLNCKIGASKDTIEIAWLPVAKFKDSASATVEDDSQPDLGDIKNEAKGRAPMTPKPARIALAPPVVVEVEATLTDDGIEEFVMKLEQLDPEDVAEEISKFHEWNGDEELKAAAIFADMHPAVSYQVAAKLITAAAEIKS